MSVWPPARSLVRNRRWRWPMMFCRRPQLQLPSLARVAGEPGLDGLGDHGVAMEVHRDLREVVDREPAMTDINPRLTQQLHQEDLRVHGTARFIMDCHVHELERDVTAELGLETTRHVLLVLTVAEERTSGVPLARVGRVILFALAQEHFDVASHDSRTAEAHSLEGRGRPEAHQRVAELGARRLGGIDPAEHLGDDRLVLLAVGIEIRRNHTVVHDYPPLLLSPYWGV
jgi:hypothetical protein